MLFDKINFKFFIKISFVAVMLLLVGCGFLKKFEDLDNHCESVTPLSGASNVSLFLNIQNQGAIPDVMLKIISIELLVDDLWIPFSSSLAEINSYDSKFIQKFLGRQWLKGQFCRGIRIKATAAKMPPNATGAAALQVVSDSEIILQNPFALEPDSRKVLFLEWDLGKSFYASESKGSALSAYPSVAPRISANLLYVACPDIDTIYVVRADKFQVVDAFAVNGKPSYLAADSYNKTIYVLSESLSKIIPYNISTHFSGSEINIPLANSPTFMTLNNTSQIAYVLDAHGLLTSIDLTTGNMLNRNRIGNRPNYIYYIAGLGKLAVSSSLDQTVYFVNPTSLVVEDFVVIGSVPHGLLAWGNYLYIAEGGSNSLSVYDLSARRMLKSINVGFDPSRLVASNNSIYVTNFGDGTMSVIQGGQLNVSKEVPIGKYAREMVVAEKQRLLFVAEGDCDGSLAVVDTTGNQVIGRIELGAKPLGIAVIE
ncbi:MAG: YncE family protein [Desulfobulbaceae bacterium]|nr:YncE family protein [Desulfobulbaceae bacterium]